MEAKHFQVDGFAGRLGIGMSQDLLVTDVPDASVCKASGLPRDVILTHINGYKVANPGDVRSTLTALPVGTASVVLTVVPPRAEQAEWWAGVTGNVQAAAAAEEDEEDYDPAGEAINTANATGADVEDEYDPCAEAGDDGGAAAPAPAPAYFPQAGSMKRGAEEEDDYYSDSSHGSDDDRHGAGRWGRKRPRMAAPPPPHPQGAYSHTADGLHPCLRNTRATRPCPATCQYRYLPDNTCIKNLKSSDECAFKEDCRNLHCKPLTDPPSDDYPHKCEPCGLRLQRDWDVEMHNVSKSHLARVGRTQQAQQSEKAFANHAKSILDLL
eukprot:TRINITY_DN2058_c0_g2_i1.p2 TRINITY_DN2058_c0_g2~~TRINITY_DN2058_c0_g2_i1.p2  ORF type:complete len:325 (+),score=106.39 TRINITY_DN2058_c0_g2_i1:140-1114(+)